MRYYLLIVLTFFLLLNSCNSNKKNELSGYWRLNYHNKIENAHIPFEIQFYGDSLKINRNNYCQKARFTKLSDSLDIVFSNSTNSKVHIDIISDSIIKFDNENYYQIEEEEFTTMFYYELFGFITDKYLMPNLNTTVLHLIKVNNKPKVILNDAISDLNNIPFFLSGGHSPDPPSLLLYISKGVSFEDLVAVYSWLLISDVQNTTLVLANDGIDKFFTLTDEIRISDSLINEFIFKNNIPPVPPIQDPIDNRQWTVLRYENHKKQLLNDSINYLLKIDSRINLLDYLKLKELVEGEKNLKIEIAL